MDPGVVSSEDMIPEMFAVIMVPLQQTNADIQTIDHVLFYKKLWHPHYTKLVNLLHPETSCMIVRAEAWLVSCFKCSLLLFCH
jgi:hypothetical protein